MISRPIKRIVSRALRTRLGGDAAELIRPLRPASREFGYDRGQPVDRYYIEKFLGDFAGDIAGRVLEIGDAAYSRRYGGTEVHKQDVLHVDPYSPEATIVGDLSEPGVLPEEAFDCIVLTQTLHLIYDMPQAIQQIHHSLVDDGVLLLTVPGVSAVDRGEWRDRWYWSLTESSVGRLLGDRFGSANVVARTYGNVAAATGFLRGRGAHELGSARLDHRDDQFPVTIAARAHRCAVHSRRSGE